MPRPTEGIQGDGGARLHEESPSVGVAERAASAGPRRREPVGCPRASDQPPNELRTLPHVLTVLAELIRRFGVERAVGSADALTVDAPVLEPVGGEDSPAHLPHLPQRRRLSRSAGVLGEKVGVKGGLCKIRVGLHKNPGQRPVRWARQGILHKSLGFSRRSIRQMGERRSVPVSASVAQTEEFHRSVSFQIFTGVAVTLRDRLSRSADPHTCPSGNQAVGRNYSPDTIPENLDVNTTIEKSALLAALCAPPLHNPSSAPDRWSDQRGGRTVPQGQSSFPQTFPGQAMPPASPVGPK